MKHQIFLLSCYCNNDEKLNSLRRNIKYIKSKNFHCALISPLPLPIDIQESVEYVIKIDENPVLEWPTRGIYFFYTFYNKDGIFQVLTTLPDYGWVCLYHVKKLGEIFSTYDYKKYIFSTYDAIITDEHIEEIKSKNTIVFGSKRGDFLWEVGIHLFSIVSEDLQKIIYRIDLQEYVKMGNGDTFDFLKNNIINYYNIEISKLCVEDEISYYDNTNLFNTSKLDGVSYFLTHSIIHRNPLKIIFQSQHENVKIFCNEEKIFENNVLNYDIIDIGLCADEIFHFVIQVEDKKEDLLELLKNIKHNTLTKIS